MQRQKVRTQVKASAPGKVILFGEHFVVHEQPAIVLAVDKRATVTASFRPDKKVRVDSLAIGTSGCFVNDNLISEGKNARKRLEPIYTIVRNLLDISDKEKGINVGIDSDIPVASGLDSSAPASVALAAAAGQLLSVSVTKDEIFEMASMRRRLSMERAPAEG